MKRDRLAQLDGLRARRDRQDFGFSVVDTLN